PLPCNPVGVACLQKEPNLQPVSLFVFRRRGGRNLNARSGHDTGALVPDSLQFRAAEKQKENCWRGVPTRYKQATPTGFGAAANSRPQTAGPIPPKTATKPKK